MVAPEGGLRSCAKTLGFTHRERKNTLRSVYGILSISVSSKCQLRGNLDIKVVDGITKIQPTEKSLRYYHRRPLSFTTQQVAVHIPASPCLFVSIYISCLACPQLFAFTQRLSVLGYLKVSCRCLIASTSDAEKQQRCIPWSVRLGWEPLHPGPLRLVWHLKWT